MFFRKSRYVQWPLIYFWREAREKYQDNIEEVEVSVVLSSCGGLKLVKCWSCWSGVEDHCCRSVGRVGVR